VVYASNLETQSVEVYTPDFQYVGESSKNSKSVFAENGTLPTLVRTEKEMSNVQ
jgi:hypothetical protein